jgi:dTDP-4-dehydrorhamnose 3,5-epimerase
MLFEPLPLAGAFRIRMEKKEDERGFFARTFCARELAAQGLRSTFVQGGVSSNRTRGTLRGLHWQAEPHAEDKLIRVTRGRMWDVLVDVRPDSPTFTRWHGETLTADEGVLLYAPRGFAHGFVTLEDGCEVAYQMTEFYEPAAIRGARYDDPAFRIEWPLAEDLILSEADRSHPPFDRGLSR